MEIINDLTKSFSKIALILGFFDGVHAGHREVINSAVCYAKENKTKSALITFKSSPAEFFNKDFKYIYSRDFSYKIIESLGVDYIIEQDFEDIVETSAKDYLESLIAKYSPISISTGFNHTFGKNKLGNANFLEKNKDVQKFKYLCSPEFKIENESVSSTNIKKHLKEGNIKIANTMLTSPFTLNSKVIEGEKIGRKIGFPTANLKYPTKIEKIPYGVYKARVANKPAVLNWGIKPTFGENNEILEVHIPDFNSDLYGQVLQVEVIDKIRDEKKFTTIEDLKKQIKKDIQVCLEL